MTKPLTDIDPNFGRQIARLAEYSGNADQAQRNLAGGEWYQPDKATTHWDGGLFSPGVGECFSRKDLGDGFDLVLTKGGTTGDLAATQLQGDFLASLERAYRLRHQTGLRARLHAAGRLAGHGHQNGVLLGGLLGYIGHIVNMSKGERTPLET